MIQRKKRNSSKANIVISMVVHAVLVFAVVFFAAREGMLGKKLKEISVTMVPKEKKPEPPKEKPPEPKEEPPKPEAAPKAVIPPPVAQAEAPPPSGDVGPAVAPAAVSLPSFEFADGAHQVETIAGGPNGIYKGLVEHSFRSRWKRPEDIVDDTFAAEVEVTVSATGKVKDYEWLSGSGNKRWDDSVRAVLDETKSISRPPPKGFPEKIKVRFDVESLKTEDAFQLGGSS